MFDSAIFDDEILQAFETKIKDWEVENASIDIPFRLMPEKHMK